MSFADQDISTPLFSLAGKWVDGKCVKCYDADSVHIVLKLYGEFVRFKCRLHGIDTPEMRTKNKCEKRVAKEARDYLRGLILGKIVFVKCHTFDKYGRLLLTMFTSLIPDSDMPPFGGCTTVVHRSGGGVSTFGAPAFERSINHHLIVKGFAYAYDGGKKKDFDEWYTHTHTYIE